MAGGSARSTRSTRKSTRVKRKTDKDAHLTCEEGGDKLRPNDDIMDGGGEDEIKFNEPKSGVSKEALPALPLSENLPVPKRRRTAAFRDGDIEMHDNPNDAPSEKAESPGEPNTTDAHAIDSAVLKSSEVGHDVPVDEIRSVDLASEARPSIEAQSQSLCVQSLDAPTRLSSTAHMQKPIKSSIETPQMQNSVDKSSSETSGNIMSSAVGPLIVETSQNQSERRDERKRQDQQLDSQSHVHKDEEDFQLQLADRTESRKDLKTVGGVDCGSARGVDAHDKQSGQTYPSHLSEAQSDYSKSEDATKIKGIEKDGDLYKNDKIKPDKSKADGEIPVVDGDDLNVIGGTVGLSSNDEPLSLPILPTCSVREIHHNKDLERKLDSSKTKDPTDVKLALDIEFQFPRAKVQKQAPSVDQLKMALYLESTRINRGAANERAFASYWESLERYITLGSHVGNGNRSSSGLEEMLNSFLTTKKLKYLHNKLLLAIMSGAIKTEFSARQISQHIPLKWKDKTVKRALSTPIDLKEVDGKLDALSSDMQQWHQVLGKESGAWTAYGKEITYSTLHGEVSSNYHASNISRASDENDVIPSARAPASLHFDSIVRRHVQNDGMRITDDASWMLIIAVQEYLNSVLRKTIANECQIRKGHATKAPKSSIVTLKCSPHMSSKDTLPGKNVQPSSEAARGNGEEISLGAAELATVLISDPLIAGSFASSRLATMRANTLYGNDYARDNLCTVQNLINKSIQQADANNGNRGERVESGDVQNAAFEKVSKTEDICRENDARNPFDVALQPTQDIEVPAAQSSETDCVTGTQQFEPSLSVIPPSAGINCILHPINDAPPFRPLAKAHFNVTSKPDPKCDDESSSSDLVSLNSSNKKDAIDLEVRSEGPLNQATALESDIGMNLATAIISTKKDANDTKKKQLLYLPTDKDFNDS